MTTAQKSPVTRVCVGPDGKEYAVTITAAGLLIREKGKRTEYGPIAYGHLFLVGAKLRALATVTARSGVQKVSRNLLRLT